MGGPEFHVWMAVHMNDDDSHPYLRQWKFEQALRSVDLQRKVDRSKLFLHVSMSGNADFGRDAKTLEAFVLQHVPTLNPLFVHVQATGDREAVPQFLHFKRIASLGRFHDREDIVFFLDDDDLMHPKRIRKQADALEVSMSAIFTEKRRWAVSGCVKAWSGKDDYFASPYDFTQFTAADDPWWKSSSASLRAQTTYEFGAIACRYPVIGHFLCETSADKLANHFCDDLFRHDTVLQPEWLGYRGTEPLYFYRPGGQTALLSVPERHDRRGDLAWTGPKPATRLMLDMFQMTCLLYELEDVQGVVYDHLQYLLVSDLRQDDDRAEKWAREGGKDRTVRWLQEMYERGPDHVIARPSVP